MALLKVGVPVKVLAEVPLCVYPPDAAIVVNAPVAGVVAPTVPLMLIEAVPVRFVTVPEEGVPRAGVVKEGEVSRTTSPVPFQVKSEDVATTVGTAETPVAFAQRELAAIAAKLMEAFAPPTCAPRVPELVRPVPTAREEVATLESAFVPLP